LVYQANARKSLTVVEYASALGQLPTANRHEDGYRIEPGMPLAEALALHQWASSRRSKSRDPGHGRPLHLEAYDPSADRLALVQLAQVCQQFSPIVGLEEGQRPESLLLDITRVSDRLGGEQALAYQLARALTERGLCAQLAVADSVGAAWGLAHYGPRAPIKQTGTGSTTLSIASRQQMLHALTELPIPALRLDAVSLDDLDQLGVERIEQLVALPRDGLAMRFGQGILRRLDQALAAAAEVITPCRWPLELAADWEFESPTSRRDEIELVLARLLSQLTNPLAAQRRGVLQLVCRLDAEAVEPCPVVLRLFRPTVSVRHLLDMFCLRLETIRIERPITVIRLAVTASDRLDFEQQTLFKVESAETEPRQLAQAIDRLTHRLGREAVLQPLLLADAQPEYACQYLPPEDLDRRNRAFRTVENRGRIAGAKNSRPAQKPLVKDRRSALGIPARPTRLYMPPVALHTVSVAPDGAPLCFETTGFDLPPGRQRVARAWGPERIETGWWRTRTVRRDYYRVETMTAERYWLFRCLRENRWFLQGAFD
jgi:protein ImuB